jgi:hypothetical protein
MITYNFLLKDTAPEKIDRALKSRFADYKHTEFVHSRECGMLQLYLLLKDRVPGCTVSPAIMPDAVNIAMTYDLPYMPPANRPFIVSMRVDYTPRHWVDVEVTGNKAHAVKSHSLWIPNLPQHELVERDPARGAKFETVGYFGRQLNHISRFTRRGAGFRYISEQVEDICKRLGLKLLSKGSDTWNDYSDVDVSIGIRDFTGRTFNNKPAAKLVNSWLAGVPFIGGMDYGFVEVGEPEWNFLRIASAKDLENALTRLAGDPGLRAAFAERGKKMSAFYTFDETVLRWETLLMGRVAKLFLARKGGAAAPAAAPTREKVTVDA